MLLENLVDATYIITVVVVDVDFFDVKKKKKIKK
jgi:hypothetical protein